MTAWGWVFAILGLMAALSLLMGMALGRAAKEGDRQLGIGDDDR